jgi:Tfp pilus assembly protein PilF
LIGFARLKNLNRDIFMRFTSLLLVFVLFFLSSCARRTNSRLAVEYYKMSLLELESVKSSEYSRRRALRYINKAIDQESNSRYLAHKATLLFLLGDEKLSLRLFDSAIEKSASSEIRCEILNNYACLLADRGRKDEALSIFRRLENDKNYLTPQVALVNQAKIYFDLGDYLLAKQKLRLAVYLAGDYVDAHYYLGAVHFYLKEYDFSRRELNRVLELEVAHEGASSLLARLHRILGK